MTDHDISIEQRTGDRSITTRYTLNDTAHLNRRGEQTRLALELTTRHDKDRKRYVSRANRIKVSARMVETVFDWNEPPLPAMAVPAPRYRAENLEGAHASYLSTARSAETLEALLTWAANQPVDA